MEITNCSSLPVLTQTALATALGAHRNTIGRWERGEVLPETKGIVLELARLLRLDEQETRLLLEASLTALAPYWTVPLRRNPCFTGRDTLLQHMHIWLALARPLARSTRWRKSEE
jgi:DNA-binding XRE family transcriptional regulator